MKTKHKGTEEKDIFISPRLDALLKEIRRKRLVTEEMVKSVLSGEKA